MERRSTRIVRKSARFRSQSPPPPASESKRKRNDSSPSKTRTSKGGAAKQGATTSPVAETPARKSLRTPLKSKSSGLQSAPVSESKRKEPSSHKGTTKRGRPSNNDPSTPEAETPTRRNLRMRSKSVTKSPPMSESKRKEQPSSEKGTRRGRTSKNGTSTPEAETPTRRNLRMRSKSKTRSPLMSESKKNDSSLAKRTPKKGKDSLIKNKSSTDTPVADTSSISTRKRTRLRSASLTPPEGERKKDDSLVKTGSTRRGRQPKTEATTPVPEETPVKNVRKSMRLKAEVRAPESEGTKSDTSPAKATRRGRQLEAEATTPVAVKTTTGPTKRKLPASAVKSSETVEKKKLAFSEPEHVCPLPCREEQFEAIWKFLFDNVNNKNSGCMYVSGVPGTGKTVIVQAAVEALQKLVDDGEENLTFRYLYINGLTLASPDKIWKRMFKGLELKSKSKGISSKEASKRLHSYFESHNRDPVVLVVDELDQILDKEQSILYQLLEWSSHTENMFSFIAIFNTMSLPEHGLRNRNASRMGFRRAVFPPYSYDQLHTIVSQMLSTFKVSRLNSESIFLLSRKVAAVSGDARRALEIARRALEIAESSNLSGIQAVSSAFKEIFSSAKIETIKYTSLLEQLVLKSICDAIRCSGEEEVLVAKICDSVAEKAVYEGMKWPKEEILKAMMRLAVMRLLIVEDNSVSVHKRVLLKVPVEDVNFALGINTDLVA